MPLPNWSQPKEPDVRLSQDNDEPNQALPDPFDDDFGGGFDDFNDVVEPEPASQRLSRPAQQGRPRQQRIQQGRPQQDRSEPDRRAPSTNFNVAQQDYDMGMDDFDGNETSSWDDEPLQQVPRPSRRGANQSQRKTEQNRRQSKAPQGQRSRTRQRQTQRPQAGERENRFAGDTDTFMSSYPEEAEYDFPEDPSDDEDILLDTEAGPTLPTQPVITKAELDEQRKSEQEEQDRQNEERRKFIKENAEENIHKGSVSNMKKRSSKMSKKKPADARKRATTIRIAVIVLMVLLVVIGALNAFMPRKQWSSDEIASISKSTNGETGFPTEKGAGMAQQFIQAYVQLNGTPSSGKLLHVFYEGMTAKDAQSTNASIQNGQVNGDIIQKIEYGPYVYESKALTPVTGTYTIGVLVLQVDSHTGAAVADAQGTPIYKWLFFSVGVYYDAASETFLISKDSPTLTPNYKTSKSSDAPDTKSPGKGEEDKALETTAMSDTISNYMEAWAASDKSLLSTQTTPDHTVEATSGMQGILKVNGDVAYKIYHGDDKYLRALVTVNWEDDVANKGSVSYVGKYVLKLQRTSAGKYLVHDIQPWEYYVDQSAVADIGKKLKNEESDTSNNSDEDDADSSSDSTSTEDE